jgi:predicted TPR repeat methyltransferase
MRTAEDFNHLYATVDPWRISNLSFRDRVLKRLLGPYIDGKSVLELGCGEGHLTRAVFCAAGNVRGIDISDVAIGRAKALNLANASFEISDLLDASFSGFDIITAIECLYYLDAAEQRSFFEKVSRESRGKLFAFSAPIIGSFRGRSYFTHEQLLEALAAHGMELIEHRNVLPRSDGTARRMMGVAIKLSPGGIYIIDHLPTAMIYQRCYIARV